MLLAVYWGPRPASLAESSRLLGNVFAALAGAGYGELRRKGRSRKEAEELRFIPDEVSIAELLTRGINRRDVDKTPIPELGYAFGLWSGGPDEQAYGFSGRIGNTTQIGSNCLLLRLPAIGRLSFQSNETAVLALFHRLVQLAGAEQGIVCESNAIEWVGRRLSPSIVAKARHE